MTYTRVRPATEVTGRSIGSRQGPTTVPGTSESYRNAPWNVWDGVQTAIETTLTNELHACHWCTERHATIRIDCPEWGTPKDACTQCAEEVIAFALDTSGSAQITTTH
jgi:hypothetical protein